MNIASWGVIRRTWPIWGEPTPGPQREHKPKHGSGKTKYVKLRRALKYPHGWTELRAEQEAAR